MQGKDEDDAFPAVDGGGYCTEELKQPGNQTVAAHEDDPGVSADEGRAHEAHDDQDVQQLLAGHIVTGHYVGNGNTDNRSGQHRDAADHQGPDQGLIVVGLGEEPDEVVECQAFDFVGEYTLGQNRVEGIHDEQAHAGNYKELCKKPEVQLYLSQSFLHRDSTSSVSAS